MVCPYRTHISKRGFPNHHWRCFRCYGFHEFWMVVMISRYFHDFWLVFMFFFSRYFHGFSFLQFTIVNDAIFLLGHPDRCFWGSLTMYGIISDGWQPSVQQCDVCDVSFKSINISYGCRQLIITIPFEIHCYSGSTVHVQLWMWRSCVSFFLIVIFSGQHTNALWQLLFLGPIQAGPELLTPNDYWLPGEVVPVDYNLTLVVH